MSDLDHQQPARQPEEFDPPVEVYEARTSSFEAPAPEAVRQPVAPEIPVTHDTLTTPARRSRNGLFVGIGAGAAAVAGVVGFMAGRGGDEQVATQPAPVTAEAPDVTVANPGDPVVVTTAPAAPAVSEAPVTTEAAQEPVAAPATEAPQPSTSLPMDVATETIPGLPDVSPNPAYANVDIAHTANEGGNLITTTRPNGETIYVPELRSLSDHTEFGESAVALMMAYMTTGDQKVLDTFSTDPETQAMLADMRQTLFIENFDAVATIPTAPNFQMVAHDTPEAPAQFGWSPMSGFVTLYEGDLFMRLSDDAQWQGLNSTSPWKAQYYFETLAFKVEESGGEIRIVGLNVSLKPVV